MPVKGKMNILVLWLEGIMEHLQGSSLVVFSKIPVERQHKGKGMSELPVHGYAYVAYEL